MVRSLRRRPATFAAPASVVVVGVAAGLFVSAQNESQVVGTIDGHPVMRAEVALHMSMLRPAVQNRIQVASGQTGSWDWEQEIDGTVPRHALQDEALEQLTWDKQILLLAKEFGIVNAIDHDALLHALEVENAQRAQAIDAGQVVYGPRSFTLAEFYTSTRTEIETRIKQALSSDPASPLYVAQTDIEAHYDADPEEWSVNVASYDVRRLSVPFETAEQLDELTRELSEAASLDDVASSRADATVTETTLDGAEVTPMRGPLREVLAQLATLSIGERTEPVAAEGRLDVYELMGKEVNRDDALATYSSRIRETIIAERFDELVADRVRQSSVKFDYDVVRSIQMEELER